MTHAHGLRSHEHARERRDDLNAILARLLGAESAGELLPRLLSDIDRARSALPLARSKGFDEHDSILITYPDMVREPGKAPLQSLFEFCEAHLAEAISCVHILPFYPASSDDGFSVVDYRSVDPAYGTWDDIGRFHRRFRLMFDAVFNHVSVRSEEFQGFLRGVPGLGDYFIIVPEGTDLSPVVRPRALPLLTPFDTPSGRALVWTTFSADQVDLNYANPEVVAFTVETLLFYVQRGAGLIRLDAIAYIWKQLGTPCIHLPQAHQLVRLFRAVLDAAAPHVALVTETNVPHEDNVSYFGDGSNEAQLVYNFALPPLALYTLLTGNAEALSRWAASLLTPSPRTSFLNFLASHDGIGVGPARGLLSETQIQVLIDRTRERGGLVSYTSGLKGEESPYELNISLWDVLADPGTGEARETSIRRFLAAHAIMLALRGVPALYFHSLFGSTGWPEGTILSGSKRATNRRKCDRTALEGELRDVLSRRARVLAGMKTLLAARGSSGCFHPQGGQRVLDAGPGVFAVVRTAANERERMLCLQNVSGASQCVQLDFNEIYDYRTHGVQDILSGVRLARMDSEGIALAPYETAWLRIVPKEGER